MTSKRSVTGPGIAALLDPKRSAPPPAPDAPHSAPAAATIQLNVRVPEELRAAIDCAARAVGMKQAPFVVQALRAYLDGHGLDDKHRALAEQLRQVGR